MIYKLCVALLLIALTYRIEAAHSKKYKKEFKRYEVSIPVLTKTSLNLLQKNLTEIFELARGKRIIWVIGDFKVGKTFIIETQTGILEIRSSPIYNTKGFHLYIDDNFVVIDTEGMNQFAGVDNDAYFVKEFIFNFLSLTADHVVFVTDQLKITDMETYDRLVDMYYSSEITDMTVIHNLKTVPADLLPEYIDRTTISLNLTRIDDDIIDDKISVKPITHAYYPLIELPGNSTEMNLAERVLQFGRNLYQYIEEQFFERSTIVHPDLFMNNRYKRRKTFSQATYIEAIDQSLRYLGSGIVRIEDDALILANSKHYKVPFIPPVVLYCLTDNRSHLAMTTSTGVVYNVSRIDASTVKILYRNYAKRYERFPREQILHPPIPVNEHKAHDKWQVFRHADGLLTVVAPVTPDLNTPQSMALQNCSDLMNEGFGEDISEVFVDPPQVSGTSNADFIRQLLEKFAVLFVNGVLKEL